jgi:hypothetical protein
VPDSESELGCWKGGKWIWNFTLEEWLEERESRCTILQEQSREDRAQIQRKLDDDWGDLPYAGIETPDCRVIRFIGEFFLDLLCFLCDFDYMLSEEVKSITPPGNPQLKFESYREEDRKNMEELMKSFQNSWFDGRNFVRETPKSKLCVILSIR